MKLVQVVPDLVPNKSNSCHCGFYTHDPTRSMVLVTIYVSHSLAVNLGIL